MEGIAKSRIWASGYRLIRERGFGGGLSSRAGSWAQALKPRALLRHRAWHLASPVMRPEAIDFVHIGDQGGQDAGGPQPFG